MRNFIDDLMRGENEVEMEVGRPEEFIGSSKEESGSNIYHGEVAFPRGVAAAVTERARPLQGVAAALAAVQGDVLLAPRHSAPTPRTR